MTHYEKNNCGGGCEGEEVHRKKIRELYQTMSTGYLHECRMGSSSLFDSICFFIVCIVYMSTYYCVIKVCLQWHVKENG